MAHVPQDRPDPLPWVLAADDPGELRARARDLCARVATTPPAELAELAASAAAQASAGPHRAVVFGGERDEVLRGLEGVARGAPGAGVAHGTAREGARVAFVFSPLRAEYRGMALGLLDRYATFAEQMAACERALAPFVEWSLDDVLRGREGTPPFERLDVSQPVLFAVCASLAELWRSFGVSADVVLGHSVGEIAAAAACGALSLLDAARVAATWGGSSMRLEGTGAMASLPLAATEVERRLKPLPGRLAISGLNAPSWTAVSGETAAVEALLAELAGDGLGGRSMGIGAPGHSAGMEPIHEWFADQLAAISPRPGTVPFCSAVEGRPIDSAGLDAGYWSRNLSQPVLFEAAIRALRGAGYDIFIEIGPRPILTGAIEEIVAGDEEAVAVGSWEQGEASQFPLQLAEAYVLGAEVDWGAICRDRQAARTNSRRSGPAPSAAELAGEPEGGLRARLQALPEAGRQRVAVGLVREQLAAVLEDASKDDLAETMAFRDLGLDSRAALALRNRLAAAAAIEPAKTVVFDHPTVGALARHLCDLALGVQEEPPPAPRRARAEGDTPVAIVGMSCRYPGGATSPDKLWELVAEGREAIGDFPRDRGWDLERLFDPDPDRPGTSYVRRGGFLEDAAEFDADFFAIGPREARAMDPQQRLLLECAWEAIEATGIDPTALAGEPVGVFAGAFASDYGPSVRNAGEGVAGHLLTGTTSSVIAGRVAYTFGLEGPAITVDTACSSSLVALHLACQALRSGECSLALAGGVTLMSTPDLFVEFSRNRALAPDGRCKSFAAGADGTAWSEGCGLLALEPLSEARRRGRRVLAVVRGSAINQDGASNGLTAPSARAQERVIRQALANAGLSAAEVDAVEAHGTGTALGDPIEAQALLATYGQERAGGAPLLLGSIKSNIGHSSAAAGIAGAIKMVMAMRHGALPKTLNLDRPSADVDWTAGEVELLGEPLPWPKAPGRPRRAAVSSFGISGTNAHLVLEEAPAPDRSAAPSGPARSSLPLLLSAKSETALRAQAERLAGHLRANPSLDSLDVAFSLAGRAQLGHRAVVVGERPDVLANLSALAAGEGAPGLVEGAALRRRETAFVFPGQGSQWVGMGLRLWRSSPCFAERMRACDAALSEFVDWSLEEVLNDAEALERVDVVQPALFAVMVSLASLWSSHGVQPAVVIGHSQGEIAAAHVAGALSLLDAARVVALRSQAIAGIAGRGGMVSVAANEEWVAESIAAEAGLAVAAVNAPTAVVVAGEREALERLLVACEDGGVRARKIAVDYASHTAQVEAIGERLLADLAPIAPRHEEVPIFSTATGARIDGRELDAEYWNRSLRNPVRFADATASLAAEGIDAFIEVSPHPVLTTAIEETAAVTALGTLRRGELDSERFMLSLAAAHANGIEVDWSPLLGAGRLADLPSYPFQRQRYWLGPGDGADLSTAGMTAVDHPLLAAVFPLAGEDRHLLSGRISLDEHPWLADHTVLDSMLLPGTAFVELAVAAGRQVGSETVEELTLEAPLQLPPTGGVPIQIVLGEEEKSSRRREVAIYSRPEDGSEWVRHASGVLIEADPLDAEAPASWPPEGAEPVDVDLLYERLGERGIHYGPAFRRLRAAWRRGKEAFAEVVLDDCQGSERFALHPALADAALHPVLSLGEEASGVADLPLPFSWHDVRLGSEAGARALRVRIAVDPKGAIELAGFTEDGSLAFSVGALRTRALDPERLSSGNRRAAKASLLALEWVPTQPLGGAEAKLAVLGDSEIHATERHADLEAAAIAVEAGKAMIETIAVEVGATADPHEAGGRALALLRKFLADERLASCRLAFVTRGAVAAGQADEVAAPGSAALWGLVRSAQSEHPGRFALVDLDRDDASVAALPQALANEEETQLALRAGRALAPRLTRVTRTNGESSIDPDGTVLITGGTGVLGRRLAAHLVRGHGARHLLLASRRGADAEGLAELAELDCEIAIETCDVSDREQLEALLDGIPVERPLTAVVHAAGVLDDGTVDSLTPERLDAVLAPKAGAAWHLDELTREMDLDAFVLFSSLTGTLGGAGQANYAAASASLDALAGHRRARGLPAISLAWGLWEEASGMTRKLNDADLARLAREGVAPLPTERALRLLDTALAAEDALLFPVCLDLAALRARARSGLLPPLLEKLAPAPADQRAATLERALAGRLAALPEEKREPLLLELVRREVATVLGHASPGAVDPGRAFKELGFDSLTAVDLRNRLNRVTGLSLSATLAFDYPTPRAVAGKIRIDFEGGNPPKPAVTSNHEQAARDAAEERVLRDIDGLDLAGLVERSLNEARS